MLKTFRDYLEHSGSFVVVVDFLVRGEHLVRSLTILLIIVSIIAVLKQMRQQNAKTN